MSNGKNNAQHDNQRQSQNSDIRKQIHVIDIMVKIKGARRRWAGRVMGRHDSRWTRRQRRLTEWQLTNGKRTKRRRKRRWRDDLIT